MNERYAKLVREYRCNMIDLDTAIDRPITETGFEEMCRMGAEIRQQQLVILKEFGPKAFNVIHQEMQADEDLLQEVTCNT